VAAATNPHTGLILAIAVGGTAIIAWLFWAFFVVTVWGSAIVATLS